MDFIIFQTYLGCYWYLEFFDFGGTLRQSFHLHLLHQRDLDSYVMVESYSHTSWHPNTLKKMNI
jgi:hypothetical protein